MIITIAGAIIVIALLILKYLFVWSALEPPSAFLAKPIFFAHRGMIHLAPENTEKAFKAAIKQKFEAIEYDIVSTKDGVAVCSHNFDLERETDARGWIKDKTWAELKNVQTGKGTNKVVLSTFEETVTSIPEHVLQNIELKTSRILDFSMAISVARFIKKKRFEDRVIVSSFNPLTLWAVKLVNPGIRTGFILETMDYFSMINWIHPDFLHPTAELVNDNLLKYARDRNLGFNVWTVNNKHSIQRLLDLGVDGIITDRHELHPTAMEYDFHAYEPSLKIISLQDLRKIRHSELREGKPYSTTLWDHDKDKDTKHYGLILDGHPVSIGTSFLNQCPEKPEAVSYQLRGMATVKKERGKGYGRQLLDGLVKKLKENEQAEILWANIRVSALPFYEKFGFKIVSDVFDVKDIGPHQRGIYFLK